MMRLPSSAQRHELSLVPPTFSGTSTSDRSNRIPCCTPLKHGRRCSNTLTSSQSVATGSTSLRSASESVIDMNRDAAVWPGVISFGLVLLMATIGLEILYYPGISSWIFERAAGWGWDGSGLRYFQIFYILPAGLVLAAVLMTYALWSAKRRPDTSTRALIAVWLANFAALGLS